MTKLEKKLLAALEAAIGELGTQEGYLPCVGLTITRQMQAAIKAATGKEAKLREPAALPVTYGRYGAYPAWMAPDG